MLRGTSLDLTVFGLSYKKVIPRELGVKCKVPRTPEDAAPDSAWAYVKAGNQGRLLGGGGFEALRSK